MKKIALLAAALLMMSAGGALAAYDTDGTVTCGSTDKLDLQMSAGVYGEYKAGGTNGETYTFGAYHKAGTVTYATSSEDTVVFSATGTGVALPAAPAVDGSVNWGSFSAL